MANYFQYYIFYLVYSLSRLDGAHGECGALPSTVTHGTPDINPSTSPTGTKVAYTCETGYEFVTGEITHTIVCDADGEWPVITDCEKVNCPLLPDDAILSVKANKFGDVVSISCDNMFTHRVPGADVGEVLTVTCTANKTWDEWDAEIGNGCIPIECVYPMHPKSVGSSTEVIRGTQTEFSCKAGYLYSDNTKDKNVTCTADGEWEAEGITNWTCIAEPCVDLKNITELKYVTFEPETYNVGDTISIICEVGYTFEDSSTEKFTTCHGNKTWDYIPVDCLPKICPPVPNATFANISTTDNWYPTWVNYTCTPPLVFPDGSAVRRTQCNHFGLWSEYIPACGDLIEIEDKFVTVSIDAKGAESFGIIALSIVGTIVGLIIVADILTFGMQLKFLKRNLKWMNDDEDNLSLDGDELMTASTISLGRGRVTPAASTVDLRYPEKFIRETQMSQSLDDVDIVNEELGELGETEIVGKKNIIPRTRLTSAKTGIQRALEAALGVGLVKKKLTTIVKRNNFTTGALPLGADNYGQMQERRPPSPVKDESESEYESTDEDDSDVEI